LPIIKEFGHFFGQLNANLALTHKILGKPTCISYEPNSRAKLFVWRVKMNLTHPRWARFSRVFLYLVQRMINTVKQLIEALYNPDMRRSLYRRLSDSGWYRQYFKGLVKELRNEQVL
jgi:hypothetical protein